MRDVAARCVEMILEVNLRIESTSLGNAAARSRHANPSFFMSSSVISAADDVKSNTVKRVKSKVLATSTRTFLRISHMSQPPQMLRYDMGSFHEEKITNWFRVLRSWMMDI